MSEKQRDKSSRASSTSISTNEPMDISNFDLEASKQADDISLQLKAVMSDKDNIKRIESATRVLSRKGTQTLDIDPTNFDLVKTLGVISKRFDEQGFPAKHVGISFKGLTSQGIHAGASHWPSITEIGYGIATLPTNLFKKKVTNYRDVIKNVHGLVKPGELLLVLGRPGAGCTSLLKTLAGEVEQFTNVDGEIKYDGASLQDMQNNFKQEVIYNPERE